jgi:hypothetical protein
MAALVTILFSIGGGTFGKGDGPSFVGQEKLTSPAPAVAAAPEDRSAVPAAV